MSATTVETADIETRRSRRLTETDASGWTAPAAATNVTVVNVISADAPRPIQHGTVGGAIVLEAQHT